MLHVVLGCAVPASLVLDPGGSQPDEDPSSRAPLGIKNIKEAIVIRRYDSENNHRTLFSSIVVS